MGGVLGLINRGAQQKGGERPKNRRGQGIFACVSLVKQSIKFAGEVSVVTEGHGGKSWQGKGVAWRLYMYSKMQVHMRKRKLQKKRKQPSVNCRKYLFFNHKHTACETSKTSRQNIVSRHHKGKQTSNA